MSVPAAPAMRPDRPLLVLRAGNRAGAPAVHEVWAYRELLFFLAWREIKVRYKQTALGAAWALIQPLLPMAIFTLTLGRLVDVSSDGAPYAVFVYVALLPWTFFAGAVTSSTNSVVGNAHLISKVYFPRLIIPAAAVLGAMADFLLAWTTLAGLMAWYRLPLQPQMLAVPLLTLLVSALALGVGLLFSALSVRYRDVRHVLPFVVQVWMFATPVVFPSSVFDDRWRWILAVNPLTGVVEAFRAAILGRPFPVEHVAASSAIAVALLIGGMWVFRRSEGTFADTI